MSRDALKKTIDKMVEESIRRVLPSVMNEVLVRALANSGVLGESRPITRPRKAPKRRKPVRESRTQQRQAAQPRRVAKPTHRDLNEILTGIRDDSAGADFFNDPRSLVSETQAVDDDGYDVVLDGDPDDVGSVVQSEAAMRLQNLPPELRGLAEDVQLDDDVDEMWEGDLGDSTPMGRGGGGAIVDPTPIRDIDRAAKTVGVDFSRMKSVIAATGRPPVAGRRELAEDVRARAQFEQARINRMRERLGGVKNP